MKYAEYGFKPFEICDHHAHIIAPIRIEDTERILEELMSYFKYSRIGIMSLTTDCGDGEGDPNENLKSFYIKAKLNSDVPNRAFVYANPQYHFDGSDTADGYLREAKELYSMGADGFKFLDGKPILRKKIDRRISDPIYDKMYSWFEEMGIPVLMHVADPKYFWGPREGMSEAWIKNGWWCGDGTFPSFEQLHEETYELLRKFPKLKFCAAHCFFLGYDINALTEFLETWENTAFDLTPALINLSEMGEKVDEWRAFFKKYSKRIFFGTDSCNYLWDGPMEKYEKFTAPGIVRRVLEKPTTEEFDARDMHFVPLGLDDDTLRDIYFNNHKALHPTARPLDRELIEFNAKKMLDYIKARSVYYESEERYALEEHNMNTVLSHFR